jgi:hypothetical protein
MEIIANPVRVDDGHAQVKCDSERELQRSNPSPLNTTVLTHELTGGLLVSSLFHPKLVVGWLLLGTFMYFVQMEGIHLPSLGSVERVITRLMLFPVNCRGNPTHQHLLSVKPK